MCPATQESSQRTNSFQMAEILKKAEQSSARPLSVFPIPPGGAEGSALPESKGCGEAAAGSGADGMQSLGPGPR